ncbi:MAG: single-stranded DNA-binding protein, partial [Nitrosomonadaceae bacterium]|nr:single-stranded DNA-binding protein [Nitrosomonadaceae bacterium]
VEGRLDTRKWTDKAGVDRYTTEVIASDMKMLGSKPGSSFEVESKNDNTPTSKDAPTNKNSGGFGDMDDDIPF